MPSCRGHNYEIEVFTIEHLVKVRVTVFHSQELGGGGEPDGVPIAQGLDLGPVAGLYRFREPLPRRSPTIPARMDCICAVLRSGRKLFAVPDVITTGVPDFEIARPDGVQQGG